MRCAMVLGILAALAMPAAAFEDGAWLQWALNAQHTAAVRLAGQSPDRNLSEVIYDPLVPLEQKAAGGELLVHYQVPLIDWDGSVYMEFKSGSFDPDKAVFAAQTWGEKKLRFEGSGMKTVWSFDSDWKAPGSLHDFWEPVFHAAVAGRFVYLPGAGGSIWKLRSTNGLKRGHINPFGATVDSTIYTLSPLTVDGAGNVYYNAVQLDARAEGFYDRDVIDSWLVKVSADGRTDKVSYKTLVPNRPSTCLGTFPPSDLPWPPSPEAVPLSVRCGGVRAAVNSAPAIGPDGAIFTVARLHFNNRYTWIVALNPDLTPRWAASLRDRFDDGCGVSVSAGGWLPPNGSPGGCREGARLGVDPATNRPGDGEAIDSASSSVTVAPDGILFGSFTRYNYAQGHLMKFDFAGRYLGSFGFGWDLTPAIYEHDGTYSVIIKNNHYAAGSYCNDDAFCPPDRTATNPASPEEYFISQLSPQLTLEWSFRNTNTESCRRDPDGSIHCISDRPAGFEWCVNAAVVDAAGIVYANSEDGNLYAIRQGGILKQRIFQQLALGAAYTPVSIGWDGKLYSQNAGRLFVVGQ